MQKGIIILLSVLFSTCLFCQVKTIQERLGYPKDAKLFIIYADGRKILISFQALNAKRF